MLMIDEWRAALIEVADDVLTDSHQPFPPVDVLALARTLNVEVAMNQGQAPRGRIKRIGGRCAMFLRPEERPERVQWAAAHELGESLVWKVCRALGLDGHDLPARQREELANQLAKEFLLPWKPFRRDCLAWKFDLPRLKTCYHTASHELIAQRFLDLEVPGVVSIFDQGVLTRRHANFSPCPLMSDLERRGWSELRTRRTPAVISDQRITVRGWCVDSPGWEREILFAAIRDGADDDFSLA